MYFCVDKRPAALLQRKKSWSWLDWRSTANSAIDLATIASGASTGGFAIISNVAGEQSGHSVSNAGDINGDGLMDIILGAPNNSVDGSANTGQSYVFYGKTSTSNVNLSDIVNNIGGFAIVGEKL